MDSSFNKNITRDRFGFIGQWQSPIFIEGGDSANYTGIYKYLTGEGHVPGKINMNQFEVSFGAYVRHPISRYTNNGFGAFYKNPWSGCISRDQLTGIMMGLIAEKQRIALIKLMLHWSLRLFLFSYNTIGNGDDPNDFKWKWPDFTGPDVWSVALRGFGFYSWIFWPVLIFLDIHNLINAFIHNFKKDDEVISFTNKFIISREHVPTPTSFLCEKILDKRQLLKELKSYWCGWRKNCGFYELYKNILN